MDVIIFIILIICWCLTLGLLYYFYIFDSKRKNKKFDSILSDLPVDMSRQQRRLFEKQLIDFKSKFSSFSNYQLNVISELCLDLIYERMKKNETREK